MLKKKSKSWTSLAPELSSPIHQNVSSGYYKIFPDGKRKFIPYTDQETGEIHGFITPALRVYDNMKWAKNKKGKNHQGTNKSK